MVEITGGGFLAPVRVTFGSVVASGAKVVSPTVIQATVPRPAAVVPGGGRSVVDVTVTNALDQPAPATDKLTGGYAYSNEESSLLISGISPNQGSYRGGTLVTITGNGFEAPVEVRFGGVSQTVVSVTPTQIQARTLPVTLTACNPSSGPVSVTNLRTGLSAGSGLTFSYTVDPLFLERASPANAGQDDSPKITITGSGFPTSPSSVRVEFGTTVSQNVLTSTATKIEVLAPLFTGPFDTQACDSNHDGTAGQQNIPTGVNLKVQNLATGCADTLLRGFIFVPNDTTCSDAGTAGGGGGAGGGTAPTASFTYSVFDKTVQFTDTSTGGSDELVLGFRRGPQQLQQLQLRPEPGPHLQAAGHLHDQAAGGEQRGNIDEDDDDQAAAVDPPPPGLMPHPALFSVPFRLPHRDKSEPGW